MSLVETRTFEVLDFPRIMNGGVLFVAHSISAWIPAKRKSCFGHTWRESPCCTVEQKIFFRLWIFLYKYFSFCLLIFFPLLSKLRTIVRDPFRRNYTPGKCHSFFSGSKTSLQTVKLIYILEEKNRTHCLAWTCCFTQGDHLKLWHWEAVSPSTETGRVFCPGVEVFFIEGSNLKHCHIRHPSCCHHIETENVFPESSKTCTINGATWHDGCFLLLFATLSENRR